MDHSKMDHLLEDLHKEIMTLQNKDRLDALLHVYNDMMEEHNHHKDSHKEPEVKKSKASKYEA